MKWSPQQVEGIKVAGGWLMQCAAEARSGRKTLSQPILRIFGYAGTGKTTIARHLAEGANGETVYAAFTGKAVEVKTRIECWKGGLDDVPWQEMRGTQQFDYGYALTVHKAQGSQWGNVVLYDESSIFRDEARRWLYTGLTRAAERVTVVTGGGAQ